MVKNTKVKKNKNTHILLAIILGIAGIFLLLITVGATYFPYTLLFLILFYIVVNIILNRISDYNYNFFVIATISSIIIVMAIEFITSGGQPPGQYCIPQPRYVCSDVTLHNSTFSVLLGQATGASLNNVNFIWVPSGTAPPHVGQVCPAAYSNTTDSGLSCAIPNSVNFISGSIIRENFTFSQPAPIGAIYTGQIWSEYQNTTGGTWHLAQITSGVVLKSV